MTKSTTQMLLNSHLRKHVKIILIEAKSKLKKKSERKEYIS